MSLGNDEKKFLELRSKLFDELEEVEKQIERLDERRDELTCILDGSYGASRFNKPVEEKISPENEFPPQLSDKQKIDNLLVDFISMEGPAKRADINDFLESRNLSPDDVRRSLERNKRRGLIRVKGRSKAAVWSAVKK